MSQASLSSSISTQGFHFTVSTTVSVASWPDAGPCSLHVLHDLDPHVYADQYELAQRPGYSSSLWGTSDLERPVSAVDQTGSILLLSAEPSPFIPGHPANATLEVPLHARYGKPVAGAQDAYHMIELRRPVGFLDCSVDNVAPVPEVLRQYTALPGWPTSSLSVIPDSSTKERLEVIVPVGKLSELAWVDVGTAVVMIAMFFYLLVTSIRTARRLFSIPSMKTD